MFLIWETRSRKSASPFAALARMSTTYSKANMVNGMIWSRRISLMMLLLVTSIAKCVMSQEPESSSEPMALSSCYQIPENRAHLAGKNTLTVLDLNFTELHQPFSRIRNHKLKNGQE